MTTATDTLSEYDHPTVRTAYQQITDDGPTLQLDASEWIEVMEVTDIVLRLTSGGEFPYYVQLGEYGEEVTVYRGPSEPTTHDVDSEYLQTLIEHYEPSVATEEDLPR